MRIVEVYIARQIMRITSMVLLIVTAGFVLERSLRLMQTVDPSALSPGLVGGILAARLPEIVGIVLPWAFFAGVLLTFQRMIRDSEIDAAYASGAGPREIVRPLLLAATIVAALLALVFWFLLPHGHYHVRQLTRQAAQAAIGAPLKPGTFTQLDDGVLYIQPRTSGGLAGIFVYQPGTHGDRYVTTAVVEDFELSAETGTLFLSARDGRRTTIPAERRRPALLTFEQVRQPVYAAPPGSMAGRGKDARELTLPELLAPPAALVAREAPRVRSQLHIRIARVLTAFLLPLLALPLALAFPAARQWIGLALGGVLVLALDQALIFGEALASRGEASPWTGIWGSIGVFLAVAAALSLRRGFRFSRGDAAAR
ncbi:MAG: LptF/LptG family permease [Sphingomonadales bacterium]